VVLCYHVRVPISVQKCTVVQYNPLRGMKVVMQVPADHVAELLGPTPVSVLCLLLAGGSFSCQALDQALKPLPSLGDLT